MPILDKNTYDEIIDLLMSDALTGSSDARHTLFTNAFMGLENKPQIDVRAGTQHIAVHRLVQGLVNFSDIGEKSALWILLEHVYELVGVEQQEQIKTLDSKVNVRDLKLDSAIPQPRDLTSRWVMFSGIILTLLFLSVAISVIAVPDYQWANWGYRVGMVAASETATMTQSPTPTITPSPTPIPQMSGEWNIAIAYFTNLSNQDLSDLDLVGNIFYNRLNQEVENLRTTLDLVIQLRNPDETGHISGTTAEERALQAEELANLINADIVIYGYVDFQNDAIILQPEIFVDVENLYELDELVGQYTLGDPVTLVGNEQILPTQLQTNRELSRRAQLISLITRGLSLYFYQDFEASLRAFEDANENQFWISSEGREVIYQLLGNCSIKLLDYDTAENYYLTALDIDDEYARAYGGLGNVYYSRSVANITPTNFEPDLDTLEQAIVYFESAQNANHQTSTADVPAKSAFGLGQIYLVQWFVGMDTLDEAIQQFNIVIEYYGYGDNKRIQEITAETHGRLGLIARQQSNYEQAIEEYLVALELAISPSRRAVYLSTLADIYSQVEQGNLAEEYNNRAIEEFHAAIALTGQDIWRARYWASIATRYERLNDLEGVENALEQALSLIDESRTEYLQYETRLADLQNASD